MIACIPYYWFCQGFSPCSSNSNYGKHFRSGQDNILFYRNTFLIGCNTEQFLTLSVKKTVTGKSSTTVPNDRICFVFLPGKASRTVSQPKRKDKTSLQNNSLRDAIKKQSPKLELLPLQSGCQNKPALERVEVSMHSQSQTQQSKCSRSNCL